MFPGSDNLPPECLRKSSLVFDKFQMNDEKWLEWIDGEIGLFSPYDPDELKIIRAIKPKGRFNGENSSQNVVVQSISSGSARICCTTS